LRSIELAAMINIAASTAKVVMRSNSMFLHATSIPKITYPKFAIPNNIHLYLPSLLLYLITIYAAKQPKTNSRFIFPNTRFSKKKESGNFTILQKCRIVTNSQIESIGLECLGFNQIAILNRK